MHVWSVQCNAFWWIHLCNHRPVKVQNTSLIQKVPSGPLPASISEGSHCSDFSHHSFALSWSSFKWNHTVRSSWRWLLRMLRCVQASMPSHTHLYLCAWKLLDAHMHVLRKGYFQAVNPLASVCSSAYPLPVQVAKGGKGVPGTSSRPWGASFNVSFSPSPGSPGTAQRAEQVLTHFIFLFWICTTRKEPIYLSSVSILNKWQLFHLLQFLPS